MKFIFSIFCLCFVAAQPDNIGDQHKIQFASGLKEMAEFSNETDVALRHKLGTIFIKRLQNVKYYLKEFEIMLGISGACIAAEYKKVNVTVNAMHKTMNACRARANNTSFEIMTDIKTFSKRLEEDGAALFGLRENCGKHFIVVMIQHCSTSFATKFNLYLKHVRATVESIKQRINKRVYKVLIDADACTQKTAEDAYFIMEDLFTPLFRTMLKCVSETVNVQ